jgi:hypothetical protein
MAQTGTGKEEEHDCYKEQFLPRCSVEGVSRFPDVLTKPNSTAVQTAEGFPYITQ